MGSEYEYEWKGCPEKNETQPPQQRPLFLYVVVQQRNGENCKLHGKKQQQRLQYIQWIGEKRFQPRAENGIEDDEQVQNVDEKGFSPGFFQDIQETAAVFPQQPFAKTQQQENTSGFVQVAGQCEFGFEI